MKVLKFDEYTRVNEGVESVIKLSEVQKLLEPFGWEYTRGVGDSCKFSKGRFIVYLHLKHNGRIDSNRTIDVGALDKLREYMIEDFKETGDLSLIKSIPWDKWRLPSPFKRELKDIDPETGNKKEVPVEEPELNIGQRLSQARTEKSISAANEKYKDSALWKIDNDDPNSAYIITDTNKFGRTVYNTCKSPEDRRPLLKVWTSDYKEQNGKYCFGKDDLRAMCTKYYQVLPDGTLDKIILFKESKNIEKNLDNSEKNTIFAV